MIKPINIKAKKVKKKNRIFRIIFLIIGYVITIDLVAQNEATLTIEQFLELVKQFHPTVKQGKINIEKSKNNITISRADFNPVFSQTKYNKTFKGDTYFDFWSPAITIPTWYGIELSANLENLAGDKFDPTETVGKTSYIAIGIPILKNLLMDKRRANLIQAKMYKEMALIEQQSLLNNILKDAATEYWEWVNAFESFKIVQKNLLINKQRLEFIRNAVSNGERPAIDTLEALIQYQTNEIQTNESWVKFQNEGLELSTYLWTSNNLPYQLPENVVPQKGWENEQIIQEFNINLMELLSKAQKNHPDLKVYEQKLNMLAIDKKLKFQDLLPKLDVKYYNLNYGFDPTNTKGLFFKDNYQYSLKFEMPLLFSKGRGEFKNVQLKIQETHISQSQKNVTIEFKIKKYYNDFLNIKKQIQLQSNMLENYKKLFNSEEILFKNGESSLFLINSREAKVLETEKKLIELKTKYFKTLYSLQWSAGILI